MVRYHVLSGAQHYQESDRHLGRFAYEAAKCVRTRGMSDAGEEKPGAQVLAEKARVSADTVENHALAFQALVEIHRGGYGAIARPYWRELYKAHWIVAAKRGRHHKDPEELLNDLDTWKNFGMSADDAEKSTRQDLPIDAQLRRIEKSTALWMDDLWHAADAKGIKTKSKAGQMLKVLDELLRDGIPALVADIRAEIAK